MFDSTTPKSREFTVVLAALGMMMPISGFHKFYLGQPLWGLVYLLLSWTPIPHIASAIEAVWFLTQDNTLFGEKSVIKVTPTHSPSVANLADSIRELDKLRTDGLISEYEFEQKRRQWLDRT